MMSAYVGIDLGTTATKAALIDSDGTVHARSRVAHAHARSAEPGRVDPTAWVASIRGACEALGPRAANASGVGLSVHCPTALLIDSDGAPLACGLTWDHPEMADLTFVGLDLVDDGAVRLSGNRLSPATFMIAAHAFFAKNEPEALARAHYLGLVGTWLGLWLTGQSGIDATQASYTGAYDTMRATGWMPDVLEALGVPLDLLPPLRASLSVLGELRASVSQMLGLPAGIPVVMGSADTPAASYALGARQGGTPLFIMGTTHVISNCVDAPDSRAQALQRVDVRPGQWLLNGVTNGGDALAIGARLLGYGRSGGSVQSLVEDAWTVGRRDTASAPVFIPHVVPERGPLWFNRPHTALIGLVASTRTATAARGVLEGVLFADRLVIESCVADNQGPIMLSGAFGSDVALPQILSDILGKDTCVLDESHLPSIGAAAMALETLEGAVFPVPISRPVHPRESWSDTVGERWNEYRDRWTAIVGTPPPRPLSSHTSAADAKGSET